ncbi:D-aminoacyl-tRNA deacylase [uncultured Jatrophihabitans sp.]|uniref:D-aminoacyl-tRNA deacylase n=1 Tax=uncultured Jatrophihabitans sp. TaxID=1610747 RepID=UPI0035CB61BB
MRAVLQRVTSASVHVGGARVAQIGTGLLALVGVTHDDEPQRAAALANKIATLRIMRDERNVLDTGAEILVVSQFTLYADTRKGRRPSWNAAAPGPVAAPLVDAVAERLRELGVRVATGVFGADMRVELINDGPVTLIVEA